MFIYINPWLMTHSHPWQTNDDDDESFSGSEYSYREKVDEKEYHGKSSKELLDTYLKDARRFTERETKNGAVEEVEGILNETSVRKELTSKISEGDIAKKETELKAQAKEAPFKAKVNYAMNAEAFGTRISPVAGLLPGMAVLAGAVKCASTNYPESMALIFAGSAMMVGGLMAGYKILDKMGGKNPEEKKAIKDYYDVKHSLLALKQLKKAIRKENGTSSNLQAQKFSAEGYGNPGGMITVSAIAKRKANDR